jgi:plastocyanin
MNKYLLGFLVLVAGLLVGWYVRGTVPADEETQPTSEIQQEVSPTPEGAMEPSEEATVSGGDKGGVVATASVQYTDGGFAPQTITVKKGTTVVFTNRSQGGMWVASAVHPTHELLPGFDQKQSVAATGTYQYTFTLVGTWKYHNHVNPTDTGTVVVTQ